MAIAKTEEFSNKEVQLASLSRALSHPARLAILKVIAEKQVCTCGDIVEVIPLAQATVSQHLKELRNSGLINGEADGARSNYSLHWKNFTEFTKMMEKFEKRISKYNKEKVAVR